MNFSFFAPTIYFGAGESNKLASYAAKFGKNVILVTGNSPQRYAAITEPLFASCDVQRIQIDGEPSIEMVQDAANIAKSLQTELIVAIGGGSVIDAGKAIAALVTNPGNIFDYLEVIGAGRALPNEPLPSIAIPTTAGTGAEVTKNAVLTSPEHRVKISLRHDAMIPNMAIIDPLLTHSMPPQLTAFTGMDAFTQLVEPFISLHGNAFTDALCREGLIRAGRSLYIAFVDGENAAAREDMAIASVCGGLALANAKLGAVHGFAGPIGGMFNAPHGVVCASLLPHVLRANFNALQSRDKASPAVHKLQQLANILLAENNASITKAIDWVEKLGHDLGIPHLRDLGIEITDFDEIAAKAEKAGSMKGNPIVLTRKELLEILTNAF